MIQPHGYHHQHHHAPPPAPYGGYSYAQPHHHHHHQQQQASVAPLYAAPSTPYHPPTPTSHNVKVHVDNCSYPINRDVLEQIFTRVAPPVKIECGPSGQVTLATVGFSDAHSAQRAVNELNNKQIYPNCCRMTLTLEPPVTPPPTAYHIPSDYHHPQHHHSHHPPAPHQHHHHHHHHHHGSFQGRGRGRGGMVPYGGAPPPASYGGPSPYGAPAAAESPVVIVSGVPETVSLHSLWVLLEVYGNVNSLKRQYSQKENVVAQFQNLYDARGVVGLLHGCPFFGSTLGVKHFAGYVDRGAGKTEWNAGSAEDPATQAVLFTSGFHHRTKPTAPYNPTQKAKPDCYLFVSNLTDTITDDDVHKLFRGKGFELSGYFRKSPVAAIVALETPARAVEALIATHAVNLQERFLRVSFSRFPPGPPPSGAVFGEEEHH